MDILDVGRKLGKLGKKRLENITAVSFDS